MLVKCSEEQHVTPKHCRRQLRPIVTPGKENFLPASINFPAPYLAPPTTLLALLLNPFHSTGQRDFFGMWARQRGSEESSADVISHRFFRVSTLIKKIKYSLVAVLSAICITSSSSFFHWHYRPLWALACRTTSFHFFLLPTLSIFSFLALEISFYFLFPSFPWSTPSSRPFQFLNEDLFGHPILLHSLQVT